MKLLWQKCNRFVLGVLIALPLAGCVSNEKLYKEIGLSREAAYQQWKNRKEREEWPETHVSGELSVEDCLKLAMVNNKVLQHVLEEKEIARGKRLKSYSAILPKIGLSADYKRLDKVSSMTIPAIPGLGSGGKITMGDVDNYSVGLTVTQPVFAGGSIIAEIQTAKLFSLLTDQTVRAAVQDLIYAAHHYYYDVLLSQHLLEISADAVRSAQAHLESVKQKRQGGVVSDFDVLRAEVELSNFQAKLIQNKNAVNVVKANLLKVMGVSQDSDVTLSDKLVYGPINVTMEEAVKAAYLNRPDLFGREFNEKYQAELLKIVRSWYWPVISGFYSNVWSNPDPHSAMKIEWGHAWQAGLMATLSIFDGFRREGEIIQQKARLKQAKIDLADAEETALFELTKALVSIEDAEEFIQSQKLNLTRAEQGLQVVEQSYRGGVNTQVEVIDAQAALTTARVNYYQAIYSHIIAKLDLQKAMGILAAFEAAEPEVQAKNDELSIAEEKASTAFVKVELERTK